MKFNYTVQFRQAFETKGSFRWLSQVLTLDDWNTADTVREIVKPG